MSRTVLVPGAGGAAAISAIKSLRLADFDGRIVSTDADPLSAGFYLADGYRVVPKAKDPEFYAEVRRLIDEERIEVILPTSAFDIFEFSRHKPELEAAGVVVAMSDFHAMTLCANKWEFYLKTHGAFPLPETSRDLGHWQRFPCFVKPTFGKGSRSSQRCDSRAQLQFHAARSRDAIVQEYLPGEEYVVDLLSDLSGTPLLAVPRIRLETKDGVSAKGRVVPDSEIEQLCLGMASHLGLKGPSCMQLKRDADGRLKFVDVSPRISGGSVFSTLAGVNIPKLLLDLIDGMEIAPPMPKEIVVLRHYEEVVLDARGY
jgi:carbamoyl-phosphate synthase large subunit